MGGWQELHIQSNIPLIVLSLSVICIVVIGFLELKKMTHKINELNVEVQNIKKSKSVEKKELPQKQGNSNLKERNIEKQNLIQKQKIEDEKKMQELQGRIDKDFEQGDNMISNDIQNKEQVLTESQLPPSTEEIMMGAMGGIGFPPMIPGGIASVILGGGHMMHMEELHVQNVYDEEIDANEEENQFEEIEDESDNEKYDEEEYFDEKEPMKNISETIIINQGKPPSPVKSNSPVVIKDNGQSDEESSIDGSESDEYSESESESESGSESESEDEKIKLIPGKGKVEEIKEVDRSLSIKELKEICQKMGLSASGNKETLIKRINSKK